MAVTDDKIAKTVTYYRKKPKPFRSRRVHSPSHRVASFASSSNEPERSAGHRELLAQLEQAFKDKGITTFPPLTDPFLRPDDRVCLLDAKQPIDGLVPQRELLPTEKELQAWIWNRRDQLDEFHRRGLTGFQQQVTLDGGRRVDILCKRPAHNQLVAIELKAARPDDRSAGQVQRTWKISLAMPKYAGLIRPPNRHLGLTRQVRSRPRGTSCTLLRSHRRVPSIQGANEASSAPLIDRPRG